MYKLDLLHQTNDSIIDNNNIIIIMLFNQGNLVSTKMLLSKRALMIDDRAHQLEL